MFSGVLLKPLTATKFKNSIDLVFATYWLLPKQGAQILLEKDIECISSKMQNSASKGKDYIIYLDNRVCPIYLSQIVGFILQRVSHLPITISWICFFTDNYQSMDKTKLQEIFTKMCLEERGVLSKQDIKNLPEILEDDLQKSPYYNQIAQLTLGQMTIYRIHLECKCEILLTGERCAQVDDQQNWSSYLGKFGTGYFNLH